MTRLLQPGVEQLLWTAAGLRYVEKRNGLSRSPTSEEIRPTEEGVVLRCPVTAGDLPVIWRHLYAPIGIGTESCRCRSWWRAGLAIGFQVTWCPEAWSCFLPNTLVAA